MISTLLILPFLLLLTSTDVRAGTIKIGVIIPKPHTDTSKDLYGVMIAAEKVNANTSLFDGHQVELIIVDDGGTKWTALQATCKLLFSGVHAIVGPALTSTSQQVLPLTTSRKVPSVSYSATSPAIGGEDHPYFARVIGSDIFQAPAIIAAVSHFNWTQICIVFSDDDYGMNGAILTAHSAKKHGISVLSSQSYNAITKNATVAYKTGSDTGCRIFINWCTECHVSMGFAHDLGILKGRYYVHILSGGCSRAVGNHNVWGAPGVGSLQQAMIGTLCVNPSCRNGPGRQEFLSSWRKSGYASDPSIYALFAHDAVLLAVHALLMVPSEIDEPFRLLSTQSCVPDSDSAPHVWDHGVAIRNAMKNVNFIGATSGNGEVTLSSELERTINAYDLFNFQPEFESLSPYDGTYRVIGNIDVSESRDGTLSALFVLKTSAIWSADESSSLKHPSDIIPGVMRVKTKIDPPFVDLDMSNPFCNDECQTITCDCPNECYIGISMDILRYISFITGFDINLSHSPKNTSFNSVLQNNLLEHGTDMVFGSWAATPERASIYSTSYAYFDTGLMLLRLSEGASYRKKWSFRTSMKKVFLPFDKKCWFIIFLVYLPIFAISFWIMEHGPNDSVPYLSDQSSKLSRGVRIMWNVWTPIYWSLGTFTGQLPIESVTLSGQMLTATFFFCNVIIIASYTANLASIFTSRAGEKVINDHDDIGTSVPYENMVLGCLDCSISEFWDIEHPNAPCYNCDDDPNNWSVEEAISAIKDDSLPEAKFVVYEAYTLMHLASTDCSIETTGEIFFKQGYSAYLPPNSLITPHVTVSILSFRETLEMGKIEAKYLKGGICDDFYNAETSEISLSIHDAAGIFFLALFFLILVGLSYLCTRILGVHPHSSSRCLKKKLKKITEDDVVSMNVFRLQDIVQKDICPHSSSCHLNVNTEKIIEDNIVMVASVMDLQAFTIFARTEKER